MQNKTTERLHSKHHTAGVVLGLFLIGVSATAMPALAADRDERTDVVNAVLGLSQSWIQDIVLPAEPVETIVFTVEIGGQQRTIHLMQHSMRAPGFRVRADVGDGVLTDVDPPAPRTYRGFIEGESGMVAASLGEDGLSAGVFLDDATWYIQPLADALEVSDYRSHVVYAKEDVVAGEGVCGTEVTEEYLAKLEQLLDGPATAGDGGFRLAEVAFDIDVEYYLLLGGSIEAVIADVENIINLGEEQYTTQLKIFYTITEIIIRTSEPDPYSSNDAETLLNQFRSTWITPPESSIPRDVAHLFTGKNIQGGTIGIAFLATVCNQSAHYGLAQSRWTGNLSVRVDLTAHEMGHNWAAPHCDGLFGGCCGAPSYTMCSSLSAPVRGEFCPPVVNIVAAFRNGLPCLSDPIPTTSLPFFEEFEDTDFDADRWRSVNNATIDDLGNGEPSPSFSLRVNGTDKPTSGLMVTSEICGVTVEYWWQRTGNTGGSPEAGEDLVLEYRTTSGPFAIGAQHPGEGPDDAPYAFHSVVLPSGAEHDAFQIRFRILGGPIVADNFFVDDISIFAESAPVEIPEHPSELFKCIGSAAEFTVTAAGPPPFTYQWMHNGVPLADGGNISGAQTDTLTISPIGGSDFGGYTVDVSNVCSTLESDAAQLIEIVPIDITTQPVGGTVEVGDAFAFFITVSGQPTFQWLHNNVAIPGATDFFLSLTNIQCEDGGLYRADLENDCGTASTDTVELIVEGDCTDLVPPVIVHQLGLEGQTRPHSGYLDPRLESTDGNTLDLGIAEVAILFSETVEDVGEPGGGLSTDAFTVTQTGGGDPPLVTSIDTSQMPRVLLTLSRPITLQEWTTIQATVQDTAETPNVIINGGNQGPGVDEGDRVDIGFMPADIDQSSGTFPLDLLRFRQMFLGQFSNPQGMNEDYIDTDRNGLIQVLDLLRYRQMLTGVSPATQVWAEESMNADRP